MLLSFFKLQLRLQLLEQIDHLLHAGYRRINNVVAEHHGKRLAPNQIACDQDRVAEPFRAPLLNREALILCARESHKINTNEDEMRVDSPIADRIWISLCLPSAAM